MKPHISSRTKDHPLIFIARWYTKYFPFTCSKGTIQSLALWFSKTRSIVANLTDGRRLKIRFPEDRGWESLLFAGEFETGTSKLLDSTIGEHDIVVDIGANIGWFTTLFAKRLKSPLGRCYSFEPNPSTFQLLNENCSMNEVVDRVTTCECALGAANGVLNLHVFRNMGSGMASLSDLGRSDGDTVAVSVATLDDFTLKHHIEVIDLIKIDVEGAEMMVLDGASKVLSSSNPPIWVVEVNTETSSRFGYQPESLLSRITKTGNWAMLRVEKGWGNLVKMKSTSDYAHGDNVFLIPTKRIARLPEHLRTLCK